MSQRSLKKKSKSYQKFRSGLEAEFNKKAKRIAKFAYEAVTFPYTVKHSYKPDFTSNDPPLVVECKGFFRQGDTMKYKAIRDQLNVLGKIFVFILSDPNTKLRKGSKMTLSQWCDKEGIKWFSIHDMEGFRNYVDSLRT